MVSQTAIWSIIGPQVSQTAIWSAIGPQFHAARGEASSTQKFVSTVSQTAIWSAIGPQIHAAHGKASSAEKSVSPKLTLLTQRHLRFKFKNLSLWFYKLQFGRSSVPKFHKLQFGRLSVPKYSRCSRKGILDLKICLPQIHAAHGKASST